MPTIGQATPTNSASDFDFRPILQNDRNLAATEGQFRSGSQHAIAVPQDALTTSGGQPLTNSTGLPLTTN